MGIEEKVKLARKTKDEKLIEEIIKYYEPIFCEKVCNKYGDKYKNDAKQMLLKIVSNYINNNTQSKLSEVLRKKVKTFFPKKHYDSVIKSENKKYIKEHYIGKFYTKLKKENTSKILNDEELMNLSDEVINTFYANYLDGDKKSTVANYFNTQINKKIIYFKDEEKMLVYYANKINLNNKIVAYFIDKYKYLLKKFDYINYSTYIKIIKNILCDDIYFQNFNLEYKIIKTMENEEKMYKNYIKKCVFLLKKGDIAYYDDVKKYYSYIVDLIYNKYKDSVIINKMEFKKILEEKYNIYFKETVNNMILNNEISIQKYINSRLAYYVKNNRYFYEKTKIDKDLINLKSDELIDKALNKYEEKISPADVLEDIIIESYYKSSKEYFDKQRKSDFASYVDYKMDYCIKKMNLNK